MKWTIFFALFLISANSFSEGIKHLAEKEEIDSSSMELFVDDYPMLRSCDSIYAEGFTSEEELHPWSFVYEFNKDSIPAYLDTTYYLRLQNMDIKSPFSFQYNDAVRSMIHFYSKRRPALIRKAQITKELYFPLFEEMLDKYQLPMELKYLAVVESALNPKAKSRVGAMGLWQFMPGTGRLYGLHINSTIDDRMNIYKATEAACQHFSDLYARYHDWNLVLAAYNAGPGNVNKAIRRAKTSTDYWAIRPYLPRETQSYVPAFIAVNYLMQYSDAHNIKYEKNPEMNYYALDTVYVNQKMSFDQIADWLEMDVRDIAKLNTQYKKKYIPSSTKKTYVLTLPKSKIGEFILNKELIISGISRKEYENQASK
jgi:membrane-bound lytic murein transglycosylase D